jgi:aldehyde dehydrogenase family 7 protein A1
MFSSRHLSATKHLTRTLSTRASNILHALGLPRSGELHGVYDGQWKGSGVITQSVCPTTGELLATVRTADDREVNTTIQKARDAYKGFRST